jgi:ribosomal protein S18 acetylase RimI-like enzyme
VISLREADLSNFDDQETVLALTDAYSCDAMGDGHPLSDYAREHLIDGLRSHPSTLIVLAFHGGVPAGMAICFGGFSTFAARPLINIHDLSVLPAYRGRGISRRLLDFVAEAARARGCCKVTLEVLENNHRARGVYEAAGFRSPVYAEGTGRALFLTRPL